MKRKKKPKILIVTPEVTYLPDRMGSISGCLTAKAGGLADVSASLICELFRQGADVHAAIPNYKAIFGDCLSSYLEKEQTSIRRVLPKDRLHLAEDRIFFHRERIYSGSGDDNLNLSLAFQREVINNIIPRVAPDLIHCNDWMTGLNPIFSRYRDQQLQLVFVADGPYQQVFKDIVALHSLNKSVAVCNFDEHLEHHAYAAADFVLMPSKFEPCGLPQMIGLIYGALPVAHDTGGLHDTVLCLDVENDFGNGFLFETFDSNGLFWAINQAMEFFMLPNNVKRMQIERIMRQSTETFNYRVTAKGYINLYEKMLQCTVVPSD